jgi:hypothetical protein
MICSDDLSFNMDRCDIVYTNFNDRYGLVSDDIWATLKRGIHAVLVVSNREAINEINARFGSYCRLVYVHSEKAPEVFAERTSDDEYLAKRIAGYGEAFELFLENAGLFHHVVIYSQAAEDMFDQVFRLFEAYSRGELK